MKRVPVALSSRPYDVVVGPGAAAEVGPLLAGRRKAVIVTHRSLIRPHTETVAKALRTAGVDAGNYALLDEGEQAKSLRMVEFLCRSFATQGLLRDDVVIAVGGGVVGDTAGFAAAVYHRGVDVVQVPTTLLAQVDAAIGGKTGVNLPEGKNLVGAFHQPLAVLADVSLLTSLPEREYRSGLGEVAKYALIEPALLGTDDAARLLRERTEDILDRDPAVLTDLVARCAAMKAYVVTADEYERTGLRATLNYGHTLAHALETVSGYDLYHGEAVAIGLVFAGHLAGALERIDADEVDRHRDLVTALGLPAAVVEHARPEDLLMVMARDKKSHGGLSFVLAGPRGLELVDDPPAPALRHAFKAVGVEG
jgi:5-deoxy-5-amino-3-dehydroquinate synthase